jgi:hypothetical protein
VNLFDFGFHCFISLRLCDNSEFETSFVFDHFHDGASCIVIESDALAFFARSGCSTRPVDVGLDLDWRACLDDEVNIRDIKAS